MESNNFNTLWDKYYINVMSSLINLFKRDYHMISDVVTDVLMKTSNNFDNYDDVNFNFVYGCCKNKIIDQLRKEKTYEKKLSEYVDFNNSIDDIEFPYDIDLTISDIKEFLISEKVHDLNLAVFNYRSLGFSYKQIESVTGVKQRTLLSAFNRVKNFIRNNYKIKEHERFSYNT